MKDIILIVLVYIGIITTIISNQIFYNSISKSLDKLDYSFDSLDKRFDRLENSLEAMNDDFLHIDNRLAIIETEIKKGGSHKPPP
jgi:peptidoglycan hydrolase CwlO-like protein